MYKRALNDQKVFPLPLNVIFRVRTAFQINEKNKWALPPGALERPFGPICSLAPDGSAHLFCSLI